MSQVTDGNVTWQVSCKKSSGELRAQFSQWSVPKTLREAIRLLDGDSCEIAVDLREYRSTFQCKITSGGEFRISNEAAELLRAQANLVPEAKIAFSLSLIDVIEAERQRFLDEVEDSTWLNSAERKKRLDLAAKLPERYQVQVALFKRNPDVVAEVLERAKGQCQGCGKRAPFFRKADSSPYLEVHHKEQLSAGGEDTVENAIALCPNCHREQHYGI